MSKAYIKHENSPEAGWGAVSDILHQQMNMREDVIALFHMNKPGGFDCPGCAWPDSKNAHSHPMEACENGSKAMAWEATSKRTTPEFFADYRVSELLQWSDYDLENNGRLTHPMKYDANVDKYIPIEWEQAFLEVGGIIKAI